MLKKKLEEALNEQIRFEFWSGYLYLSMSAYFEERNLAGFANWMNVQFQEEQAHAMKFFRYIHDRGGSVKLQPIQPVDHVWDSPLAVFETTLKHEQEVSNRINNLVDLARDESDHATFNMLQWYIQEQVEEEANVDKILQQLNFIKNDYQGLFMIDRELAQRVFVDPTQTAK